MLEGRASALELDKIRANALPVDYETDIELPWANPSETFSSLRSEISDVIHR